MLFVLHARPTFNARSIVNKLLSGSFLDVSIGPDLLTIFIGTELQ